MIKLWLQCDNVKITKLSNCLYISFKKKSMMGTFKRHWAGPKGCHMTSELGRHRNSILNRFFLKTAYHYLLSVTFLTVLIYWPLFPAASSVFRYWSCFVCSGLTYENKTSNISLNKKLYSCTTHNKYQNTGLHSFKILFAQKLCIMK